MKQTLIVLSIILALTSCNNHSLEKDYPTTPTSACDTATTPATFSGGVKKIIVDNCATPSCHSASTRAAGVDLSAYTGIKAIADNGKLIRDIIWSNSGSHRMPQGGTQMSDCNIKQIVYWVNKGAQNN
ncbi:MAG: hypothetical protein EBX41_07565 [Chitinophagia bacterium]|nr:hypothetical protein [Chitinophagia bacterium]